MAFSLSWFRQKPGPIGIDFGSRAIRMLQLSDEDGQHCLVDSAEQLLPEDLRNKSEYKLLLGPAVSNMLNEGHFVGRDVVTALPWDALQIRNIRVPATHNQQEIEAVVRRELLERFGLDPIDAEYRFMVAGDIRRGDSLCQEVIVLAADHGVVHEHLNTLEQLGLHPVAVDAGPCAVFRSFERYCRRGEDHNKFNAFVDMGYQATRVIVTRGAEIVFFKSIPVGGRHFDQRVAQDLGLNLHDASKIRNRAFRETGVHEDDSRSQWIEDGPAENLKRSVFDILRPDLEQLSKEVALCLRYCSATFRGLRAEAIRVVGGEACNPAVLRYLSDQMQSGFQVGQPLRGIHFRQPLGSGDRRTGLPEWTTAVGLALKPVVQQAEVAT